MKNLELVAHLGAFLGGVRLGSAGEPFHPAQVLDVLPNKEGFVESGRSRVNGSPVLGRLRDQSTHKDSPIRVSGQLEASAQTRSVAWT